MAAGSPLALHPVHRASMWMPMPTSDEQAQAPPSAVPATDEILAAPDTVAGSAPVARPKGARADWQVLRSLLPFLRPFAGRIGFALLLVVLGKLANLVVPLVLKKIVDALNVAPTLLVLPVALLLAYGASRVS